MSAALADVVVAILRDHDEPDGWTSTDDGSLVYQCNCGDQSTPITGYYIEPADAEAAAAWHRDHVAALVVDVVDRPGETAAPTSGEQGDRR